MLSFDKDSASKLLKDQTRLNLYFYFFKLIIYETDMTTIYLKMFINRCLNYWEGTGDGCEI